MKRPSFIEEMDSSRSIFLAIGILICSIGTGWAEDGARSPMQLTRDGESTLVQKEVGDDQWTISYEIQTGHVTGNVRGSDGTSTFLDCIRVSYDLEWARYYCYAAAGCTSAACDGDSWDLVGEVELLNSFFLPENIEVSPPVSETAPEWWCCLSETDCFEVVGSINGCVSAGGVASPRSTEAVPAQSCSGSPAC